MPAALGLTVLLLQAAALQGADIEVKTTGELIEKARRPAPGTRIVLTAYTRSFEWAWKHAQRIEKEQRKKRPARQRTMSSSSSRDGQGPDPLRLQGEFL